MVTSAANDYCCDIIVFVFIYLFIFVVLATKLPLKCHQIPQVSLRCRSAKTHQFNFATGMPTTANGITTKLHLETRSHAISLYLIFSYFIYSMYVRHRFSLAVSQICVDQHPI